MGGAARAQVACWGGWGMGGRRRLEGNPAQGNLNAVGEGEGERGNISSGVMVGREGGKEERKERRKEGGERDREEVRAG